MNKGDAERLTPGVRVCYLAGGPTACSGTVVQCDEHGVTIKWDDGQVGIVLYPEMQNVERYDGQPIIPSACP